jgi:iron complex outermembrane receptor protein
VPLFGGDLQGVWGAQADSLRFSALGEEAFVPGTDTRSRALFALEEWRVGAFTFSLGARAESVRVSSDGDEDPSAPPRFGAAESRSFAPRSTALALKVVPAAGWKVMGSMAWTQRAPTYYELYANGLHLATGAFERGDTGLGVERNRHAELGVSWATPGAGFSAQVFKTDFARYISLDATGQIITIPGDPGEPSTDVPEYLFRAVRARLTGAEIEGHATLFKSQQLTLEWRGSADTVRGTDLDGAQPLPRLSPWRARVSLLAKAAQWRAGVDVRHHAAQDRVPSTDAPTPGFTMLDLWAAASLPVPGAPQLIVKLGNATNELATSASTIATIRGLSPLPGRALSVVLRAAF